MFSKIRLCGLKSVLPCGKVVEFLINSQDRLAHPLAPSHSLTPSQAHAHELTSSLPTSPSHSHSHSQQELVHELTNSLNSQELTNSRTHELSNSRSCPPAFFSIARFPSLAFFSLGVFGLDFGLGFELFVFRLFFHFYSFVVVVVAVVVVVVVVVFLFSVFECGVGGRVGWLWLWLRLGEVWECDGESVLPTLRNAVAERAPLAAAVLHGGNAAVSAARGGGGCQIKVQKEAEAGPVESAALLLVRGRSL